MLKAYSAANLVEAQFIIDLLQQHGIPTMLFNDNQIGGLGELPVSYPEVWVKRDLDFDKAVQQIRTYESKSQPLVSTVCPQCGETNPDTFEFCWQCHHTLIAAT